MSVFHKGETYHPASILGGLPVMVTINAGYDSWNNEHWSEVTGIYWQKRNGKPGKAIPDHIHDRAESYDYGFCNLLEGVFDAMALDQDEGEERPPLRLGLD